MLKAAVFSGLLDHQRAHAEPMAAGLARHGLDVSMFDRGEEPKGDFIVVWGWKLGLYYAWKGRPVLVMERGYLGDRMRWTSLGWDGLNGRARFPKAEGDRWERFADLMQPWKRGGEGYALIVGQVDGDMSLQGVDVHAWYRKTSVKLHYAGWDVRFRQHPVAARRGDSLPNVPFAVPMEGTLEDALEGAALVATFNSNVGVDALLAGRPVHAEDEGSMVFHQASHNLSETYPDREARFRELSNCQWSIDEIADGSAWEVVRTAM